MLALGQQHLGDAVELGRLVGHPLRALPRDEHVDLAAQLARGGQRLARLLGQGLVVMFGQDQSRHQITPSAFFNLSTSSSTEPTMTPASRPFGSTVFSTSWRGVISTP